MAKVLSHLGRITIANTATDGNVLSSRLLASAEQVIIKAPAALTGTVTVYGSQTEGQTLANCQPIREADDAADYTVVAGKEMHYPVLGGLKSISLKSGSAEGAERQFEVYVIHEL